MRLVYVYDSVYMLRHPQEKHKRKVSDHDHDDKLSLCSSSNFVRAARMLSFSAAVSATRER